MGITIFKIFTWGGISTDICSGILFYGDTSGELQDMISEHISDDIPPLPNKNLNTVIPYLFCLSEPRVPNHVFCSLMNLILWLQGR